MQITITNTRTTPCTMAPGQWVTELIASNGQIIDPFLHAIDECAAGERVQELLTRGECASERVGPWHRCWTK